MMLIMYMYFHRGTNLLITDKAVAAHIKMRPNYSTKKKFRYEDLTIHLTEDQ